jgi:hypothetical protein
MYFWIIRWLSGIALLGCTAALLGGCDEAKKPPAKPDFLARHWTDPLLPQGAPPKSFSALEASLAPKACGQCHDEQYQAWRTSLHSRAVGPGLLWQLKLMDQVQANRCLRCHAPLAEQKALLALEHGWQGAPTEAPPAYVDAGLGHDGLVCAACHLREHRRFGPPARGRVERIGVTGDSKSGVAPARVVAAESGDRSTNSLYAPHGGFTASTAFADSRFCAHCHQFAEDAPRINGKLQEDTFRQWQASPQARDKTCQTCHMPDRKHLWRGIHDPAMTRSAIEVSVNLTDQGNGQFVAQARVRNVGAGHHFPTYMVPKVELSFLLHDAGGGTRELGSQVIGWSVDTGITSEIADTRIPAGASSEFEQPFRAPGGSNWWLELVLRVRPGEHYERIFKASLAQADRLPPAVLPLLNDALKQVRGAEYELLRVRAEPLARAK